MYGRPCSELCNEFHYESKCEWWSGWSGGKKSWWAMCPCICCVDVRCRAVRHHVFINIITQSDYYYIVDYGWSWCDAINQCVASLNSAIVAHSFSPIQIHASSAQPSAIQLDFRWRPQKKKFFAKNYLTAWVRLHITRYCAVASLGRVSVESRKYYMANEHTLWSSLSLSFWW